VSWCILGTLRSAPGDAAGSRRFFDDDDARRREPDALLEALDAAPATPAPSLFPRVVLVAESLQDRDDLAARAKRIVAGAAVCPPRTHGLAPLCAVTAPVLVGAGAWKR
jgi:hypothetical protein